MFPFLPFQLVFRLTEDIFVWFDPWFELKVKGPAPVASDLPTGLLLRTDPGTALIMCSWVFTQPLLTLT